MNSHSQRPHLPSPITSPPSLTEWGVEETRLPGVIYLFILKIEFRIFRPFQIPDSEFRIPSFPLSNLPYTSMLCLCISMSCCIHQCYIKGVYISFVRCKSSFKCHKSMLSVIHLSCNVASRSDIVSFV